MAYDLSLKGKEIFCADRIVNEGRATLFEDVGRVADAIARKNKKNANIRKKRKDWNYSRNSY